MEKQPQTNPPTLTVDEPEIGVTKKLTELFEETARTLAAARSFDNAG